MRRISRELFEIIKTVPHAEIIEAVKAARKQKRMTTGQMVTAVAKCIAEGRPYWPVAKKLRPDLPLEKAKHYLRSRVSKNRAKIDAAVQEYKRKHVTK